MKILNLVIKNPNDEKIREIYFEEKGISIIYGKVNKPKDEKETSNSIGKTLLLKFIDYIYGANESSEIVKPIIHNWYLEAVVKYKGKKYNVKRFLGKSELIVNGESYELSAYKEYFNIDRKLYNKQIYLTPKSHLISTRSEASLDDYTSLFYLLDLQDLSEELVAYYEIQNKIKELTTLEKRFIQFFEDVDLSQIEEKIFFINKSINEKENELKILDEKITNIQIGKEKSELMDEYATKNYELKELQVNYQKLNLEYKRLSSSLNNFKELDISSKEIKALYKKASIEIPELIKKRFDEVEEFQKSVYSDRKKLISDRLEEVEDKQSQINRVIKGFEKEIEKLANIISQNEIYQESIAIYKEKSMELQNLMYEQGELSKIDAIIKERKDEEDKLATRYSEVKIVYTGYKEKIDRYKNFIFEMVQNIYTDKVEAYFSIKLKNRHKRNRPFSIELNLTGDTGEGVGEVRKLLIDLLVLKYNNYLSILIQDSACFSGIDNRQVCNLLKLGYKISDETDKQYIISINDYQINKNDKELIELIGKYTKLELDENDKLLKFNF